MQRISITSGGAFSYYLAALFCLLFMASGPVYAAGVVPLASLDLSGVEQGWGTAHKNQSVDGHGLSIGGRKFEHGLGTHSPGIFIVNLNGGSARFRAWAGIDDEVGKRGSASFTIIGDGKTLWNSGVMRGGEAAKQADVEVAGVKTLLLIVGDGGDGFEYDHADWADAQFEVRGAQPTAMQPMPGRDMEVAAPVTPARPFITDPRVVGARVGAPFLFTIPALGERPLKFAASRLPQGLTLDASNGRIKGALTKPGTYNLTLRAANAAGAASAPLRIEAGSTIALTPPLGWNSYDAFGDAVTEAETLANAQWLKERLQPYGYEYVVVDYRWYDPGTLATPNNPNGRAGAVLASDGYGRLVPASERFPSAQDGKGFTQLAGLIHGMGLKFGIHIMRGIPRQAVKANTPIEGSAFHASDAANTASICPWCPDMYGVDASKPAGQAWYDSLLRQYAAWGVDLIKVDDMSAPYSTEEIEAVRNAIEKCGRAIVLSLSPGDTPLADAAHVQAHANMWRISGDFWDEWKSLNHQFDLIAAWSGHGNAGHWPDADMIPLGHLSVGNRSVGKDRRTRLTHNEQITLMSLWALAPSPQMLGMNLPDNDAFTTSLLCNEEALAINQDAGAYQAHKVTRADSMPGVEIWIKELADGTKAVGLFNRLGVEMPVVVKWPELGMSGSQRVRDVWQRKDLGARDSYEVNLPPHAAALLRVGTGK